MLHRIDAAKLKGRYATGGTKNRGKYHAAIENTGTLKYVVA
jgi:hypothetical protein